MERRHFIGLSAVGSVLGSTIGAFGAEDEKAVDGMAVGHPVVMGPREDGVEIVWRVSGLAKGAVEYGKTKELGQVARNDGWGLCPTGKQVLKVRIDGLEAGVEYFYRVVTEETKNKGAKKELGAVRRFRTLDGGKGSTKFTVWNDTHQQAATIEKLHGMTKGGDFLLWNGDVSNDFYREGQVAKTILTPGDGVDFTRDQPLVFLRGNHDLRGPLAYEVEETVATASGKPWCAFRSGPVAFICMDTGEDKDDDHPNLFGRVACEPMRAEQAEWLAKVIEEPGIKDAPYRVLVCHIPLRWFNEDEVRPYDSFSRRSRDLWHDSLVKWGAQIVVSGHTHRDAFIEASEGFPYAQLVGGGPRMGQARLIEGAADAERLKFTMTDMEGKVVRDIGFKPIG